VTLTAGARRIRGAFDAVSGRPLLVAYLMAGYPDEATSVAAAEAALESGADLLEIGIPFSDPVADGPVIAAAGHAAVAGGAGFETALRVVAALRRRHPDPPIMAMGYLNPIVARGVAPALRELADAGVDGIVVPDLPAGEDHQLERLAAAAGLGIAFLVTPNTPVERLERVIGASTAFLYVVPVYGVTGARDHLAETTLSLLMRVRATAAGRLPVAVGFGVSRPEHVHSLAPATDGIIVGSAIIAALNEGGPAGVGRLVAALAGALERQPA
jgi:tryptophan synthase alpha chain